MEKTMTLNLHCGTPTVKQQITGCPGSSSASRWQPPLICLRQITLTGGIPYLLSLPKAPAALNADTMTDDQLHAAPAGGHQRGSER